MSCKKNLKKKPSYTTANQKVGGKGNKEKKLFSFFLSFPSRNKLNLKSFPLIRHFFPGGTQRRKKKC